MPDPTKRKKDDVSEGSEIVDDEASQGSSKRSKTSNFSDSEQSREQDFLYSEEKGRDLNPLLTVDVVVPENIYDMFSELSETCNQGLEQDSEKLHYFDLSFGRTGIYRLESYFDKDQCEAKRLLQCRRKPAYRVLCYDEITKKLYSELDLDSLSAELGKIKEIIPKDKLHLIEFINNIGKANTVTTKEYEFWQQQLASPIPEKIDTDRNNFGQSLQNLSTGSFFSEFIEVNDGNPTICLFHDDHSAPLIPNVVLKLIVDSNFIDTAQKKVFLYLECFNNNYQTILDKLYDEFSARQKNFEEILNELREYLYTSLENTSDTESNYALNAKAELIVRCMQKGIKPIAIDVATDTTRQFQNTHVEEVNSIESDKETRLKLGDQGFVYFIKNNALHKNVLGIALFGGEHVKIVKGNLATEMSVFDVHVSPNMQKQVWEVSSKSTAFPEINADLFITVPLNCRSIQTMPQEPIQIIVSESFRERSSATRNRSRSPGQ